MRIASITDNDSVNSITGFTTCIFFQGCLSIIAKVVIQNKLGISMVDKKCIMKMCGT